MYLIERGMMNKLKMAISLQYISFSIFYCKKWPLTIVKIILLLSILSSRILENFNIGDTSKIFDQNQEKYNVKII